MKKVPTTLIIMDGFGVRSEEQGNAIRAAATPNLDRLLSENPHSFLAASGPDVGLPEGQMGNSEVGHTNIGAGRVVMPDLPRISKMIADGELYENPVCIAAMDACREKGGALHLMGLLSDGGVHSHIDHLFALLEMAKMRGLTEVYIHCFLDGRDVPPTTGADYVERLQAKCDELGVGRIAGVMGRYYAMDRDKRWERLQVAYDAVAAHRAERVLTDPVQGVRDSYAAGITDEFVVPFVCEGAREVRDGDSILFFNFRADRARELTRCFVDPDFTEIRRETFPAVKFVCMAEYDAAMPNVEVVCPHESFANIFGSYIASLGLTQLRIAETEKYAHVTFFFNGSAEVPFPGEDRCLIPSPKVATYDLQPEMSAREVAAEASERIASGKYDVVILNFANCDMVGHTGVFDAAVKAVETVDECVARVVEATRQMGGVALITADHGNAEQMLEEDGVTPHTAHTTNKVPFCIVGADVHLRSGRLADIAPTMLDLMGLARPDEMTGRSLIVNG